MSKALRASCAGGVVTFSQVPITNAEILSEGMGPSDGILMVEHDEATYITSSASDLKATLDELTSVLSTIAITLTSIGTQMLGPATAPPPTLPSNVALINAAVAELTVLKETLK